MTRVPANLPPSLLALNPRIPATAVRKGNILHAQRLAGCPPADLDEQERRSMQAAAALILPTLGATYEGERP